MTEKMKPQWWQHDFGCGHSHITKQEYWDGVMYTCEWKDGGVFEQTVPLYATNQFSQAVEEVRDQYDFPIDCSWAEAAAHESGFHIALDRLSARLGLEEENP